MTDGCGALNKTVKSNHRIDFSIEVDGKTWAWVGSAYDPQSYLPWINMYSVLEDVDK